MISKTKINKRMNKKRNLELAEAIFIAKKNNQELAQAISVSTRRQIKVNIEDLNKAKGDSVIIPGKVLSLGEIDRKLKVYALGFSKNAKEKLEKAGCKAELIQEAIKKEPNLKGEIFR